MFRYFQFKQSALWKACDVLSFTVTSVVNVIIALCRTLPKPCTNSSPPIFSVQI